MSLDLILEFVHHIAVFSLVGLLFAEFVLVRPGIAGDRLTLLGRLDGAYGGFSTLVILAGVARVIWGDAGWEFYVMNWVFWGKMVLFIGVGLLSIKPTVQFVRWRRAAASDTAFAPPPMEIADTRRWMLAELGLLFFIPIFAAMMARGIGL
jgi:putative membrane protein